MWKQLWSLGIGVLVMTCLGGCTSSSLPNPQFRVGGGFDIDYDAPSPGTAIWADAATGRVLETKSLDRGERFETSMDPADENVRQVFGGDVSKARPVLFFVPVTRTWSD